VAVDVSGSVYIADQNGHVIRKVSKGGVGIVAGNGEGGISGDGGPAISAQISYPRGVAVDPLGNLYIADDGNNRVRKVAKGVMTTIAGTGEAGYSGDNGLATSAQLRSATGVAVDASGNVYVADTRSHVVRKVSKGIITTVAGIGTSGYSGDGGPARNARLNEPVGVAVDASGSVYIADSQNHVVRRVSKGSITTICGDGQGGYSGDNGPATSAQLHSPTGVAVDASGNLYIADEMNNRIRKVTDGVISTIAGTGTAAYSGDDGTATSAQLNHPSSVAVDALGNVYFSDSSSSVVRILVPERGPALPLP
jgi:sugar lactone lactonase YvrE